MNGSAAWILRKECLEIEAKFIHISFTTAYEYFDILTCRNQNLVTRLQVQLDFFLVEI